MGWKLMTAFDRLFMYIMTLSLVQEEASAAVKQCAKRVVSLGTVSLACLALA